SDSSLARAMTRSAMSPRTADSIEVSSRKSAISTWKRSGMEGTPSMRRAKNLLVRGVRQVSLLFYREQREPARRRARRDLGSVLFSNIGRGEGSRRMPRIKTMLAEGKVVRVFGCGQLLSPKLIEILGEHGEFDALWLDQEHAGLTMKEIELA